jgi:hypothetical protein
MATRRPAKSAAKKEDDVRSILGEDEESDGITLGDDFEFAGSSEIDSEGSAHRTPTKFLGMSAGERAFLSVILFFNVLILGAALLFVTGRLQF